MDGMLERLTGEKMKKFTIAVFGVMLVFLVLAATGNIKAYVGLFIVLGVGVILWTFYDLIKN